MNTLAIAVWLGSFVVLPGLGFAAGLATTGQHFGAMAVTVGVVISVAFGIALFASLSSYRQPRGVRP